MMIVARCPHCDFAGSVRAAFAGHIVRCSACSCPIRVPPRPSAAGADPEPPATLMFSAEAESPYASAVDLELPPEASAEARPALAVPSRIELVPARVAVMCACGKKGLFPASHAGRRIKCKCGRVLAVPGDAARVAARDAERRSGFDRRTGPDAFAGPERRSGHERRLETGDGGSPRSVVLGIGAGLALVALGLSVALKAGEAGPTPLRVTLEADGTGPNAVPEATRTRADPPTKTRTAAVPSPAPSPAPQAPAKPRQDARAAPRPPLGDPAPNGETVDPSSDRTPAAPEADPRDAEPAPAGDQPPEAPPPSAPPPLRITTSQLPAGRVRGPYAVRLQAEGGRPPLEWSLAESSAPIPGLALSPAGELSGAPTRIGDHVLGVQVTDAAGRSQRAQLRLRVALRFRAITKTLPAGRVGEPYAATLECLGGAAPRVWSRTSESSPLPAGLHLASDGEITGTPQAQGRFHLAFAVTEAGGDTATLRLDLRVRKAEPELSSRASRSRSAR